MLFIDWWLFINSTVLRIALWNYWISKLTIDLQTYGVVHYVQYLLGFGIVVHYFLVCVSFILCFIDDDLLKFFIKILVVSTFSIKLYPLDIIIIIKAIKLLFIKSQNLLLNGIFDKRSGLRVAHYVILKFHLHHFHNFSSALRNALDFYPNTFT